MEGLDTAGQTPERMDGTVLRSRSSGPVDDLTEALAMERERTRKTLELDREIKRKADARAVLGDTTKPGPVINANTVAGALLAALAIAGVVLTQEEIDALEVILAALVPFVVNLAAGYQARRQVTPVK